MVNGPPFFRFCIFQFRILRAPEYSGSVLSSPPVFFVIGPFTYIGIHLSENDRLADKT